MPTVPNIDPGQLEAMTGGMYQPDPARMLMAASDMHDKGRLIVPEQQSSNRTGANMNIGKRPRGRSTIRR